MYSALYTSLGFLQAVDEGKLSLFARVSISDINERISIESGISVYNELSHQFIVN